MTKEEFVEWMEGLQIQTLTDELKQDIIEKATDLYTEGHAEGYGDAKHEIINHITYDM